MQVKVEMPICFSDKEVKIILERVLAPSFNLIFLWEVEYHADDRSGKRFLEEFRNRKYYPQYLFEDTEMINRLKNYPMALWKIQDDEHSM